LPKATAPEPPLSAPPQIAVFVDRSGLMPAAPFQLVLRTAQPVEVAKFYRALGVEIRTDTLPDGTRYYAGRTVGLNLSVIPAPQTAPYSGGNLYFLVENVDAAVRAGTAEGGKLLRPATPYQRRALLFDPEGRRVFVGERSAYASQFDDLDSDHRRKDSDEPGGGGTAVDFTDPAVRRALSVERAAAAVIAVGTLVVAVAASTLFVQIAQGTDRDFQVFQLKPAQTPYYLWAWGAVVGIGVIVAGRGVQLISGDRIAKTGFAALALAVDGVALAMGLKCVLGSSDSSMFLGSVLFVLALGGIVGSSRMQEAAATLRRPELRFWTKGATGASVAMLLLPLLAISFAAVFKGNSGFAKWVLQATFLVGLVMQACAHVAYLRVVHSAIADPDSVA